MSNKHPHPLHNAESWEKLQKRLKQYSYREWEKFRKYLSRELVPHAEALLPRLDDIMRVKLSTEISASKIDPRTYLDACRSIDLPAEIPRSIARDPGEMRAIESGVE